MTRGSLIPAGITIAGEIRGQGDLTIAGALEGPIQIDGHLVIDAGATVRGDVKARSIVIRGTLLGPAIADETIKLEVGAKMVGDARADRVSVVDGALLRGRITMTGAQASRRSSSGSVAGVPAPVTLVDRASPIARSSSGVLTAPREAPPRDAPARDAPAREAPPRDAPVREAAPRDAPAREAPPRDAPAREAAPRDAVPFEEENRTNRFVKPSDLPMPEENRTNRYVKPTDLPLPRASEPAPSPRVRRPPEPVIPGVGRQRARRKDGGLST